MTELAELTRDLLAGTERRDLPSLTREELLAAGVPLVDPDDLAWADALTPSEHALLGEAGARSLSTRGLLAGDGQPRDELLPVLMAAQAPGWLVLLEEPGSGTRVLLRGIAGTGCCVVSSSAAGVHVYTLVHTPAARREAAAWLAQADGVARAARRVGPSGAAEIRVAADEVLTEADLLAWLEEMTDDAG